MTRNRGTLSTFPRFRALRGKKAGREGVWAQSPAYVKVEARRPESVPSMRVPRPPLAPLVAACLLAGCVGGDPGTDPEAERPDPEAASPSATPPPLAGGFPGLTGQGGTGVPAPPGPAPPNPAPPAPSQPPPSSPPPPPSAPPVASTPPQAPPPAPTAPPASTPWSPEPWRAVRLSAGADAAPGRYVQSFTLGADGASFSASLRGVPEARVDVGSLFRLHNDDASWPQAVRLSASRSGAATGVEEARVVLRDAAGAPVATLDLLAASPAVEVRVPGGATLEGSWSIALGPGAGAPFSWTLRLDVGA